MHLHSKPTEQISTAHRYTSETQKHARTHQRHADCFTVRKHLKEVHVLLSYLRHCSISFGLGYFCSPRTMQCQSTTNTHTHTETHQKYDDLPSNKLHRLSLALVAGRTCTTWRKREKRSMSSPQSSLWPPCRLITRWLEFK